MSAGGTPLQAGATPTGSRGTVALRPDAGPSWLRPLVDNVGQIPDAYRRRLPADVLAMVTAAGAVSAMTSSRRDHREAAVLVLFLARRPGQATVVSQTTPTYC